MHTDTLNQGRLEGQAQMPVEGLMTDPPVQVQVLVVALKRPGGGQTEEVAWWPSWSECPRASRRQQSRKVLKVISILINLFLFYSFSIKPPSSPPTASSRHTALPCLLPKFLPKLEHHIINPHAVTVQMISQAHTIRTANF